MALLWWHREGAWEDEQNSALTPKKREMPNMSSLVSWKVSLPMAFNPFQPKPFCEPIMPLFFKGFWSLLGLVFIFSPKSQFGRSHSFP